jgi:hypothetical protein
VSFLVIPPFDFLLLGNSMPLYHILHGSEFPMVVMLRQFMLGTLRHRNQAADHALNLVITAFLELWISTP